MKQEPNTRIFKAETDFQEIIDFVVNKIDTCELPIGNEVDPTDVETLTKNMYSVVITKHEPCEFCDGSGEFSRDNSDGVAVEGTCDFCKGTGIDSLIVEPPKL